MGTREQAIIDGKKGGRPKGSKATHTILAEKAKANLIAMYIANVKPLDQALIDKALLGDIMAQKELRDRVFGKSPQAITGPDGGAILISGVEINVRK